MTEVVNIRDNKPFDVLIDRRSIFGNPFDHRRLGITRHECVERYREYFHKRLKTDPEFKKRVLELKDKRLGCWCVPLECHGEVIKEYLDQNDEHN